MKCYTLTCANQKRKQQWGNFYILSRKVTYCLDQGSRSAVIVQKVYGLLYNKTRRVYGQQAVYHKCRSFTRVGISVKYRRSERSGAGQGKELGTRVKEQTVNFTSLDCILYVDIKFEKKPYSIRPIIPYAYSHRPYTFHYRVMHGHGLKAFF